MSDKILRDPFTDRLLQVFYELITMDAIASKKDFASYLGMTNNQFYNIENGLNNIPKDEQRRHEIALSLMDKYGVNSAYLKGTSSQKFLRQPPKVKRAVGEVAAKINFANKGEKRRVLEELELCKQRVKDLEAQLAEVLADPVAYVSKQKPDRKPDKK